MEKTITKNETIFLEHLEDILNIDMSKKDGLKIFLKHPESPTKSMLDILDSIYKSFDKIEEIHIPQGGTWFTTEDGKLILFQKSNKTVKLVIALKSQENIVIPEGVITVDQSAFVDKSHIRAIFLPDSLQEIEAWTFSDCENLENVRFPKSLRKIGNYAFQDCSNLKKAILSGKMEYIGSNAFRGCASLSRIGLPDELPIIGDRAFQGCTNLKEVTLPKSLRQIGYMSFCDTKIFHVNNSVSGLIGAIENGWDPEGICRVVLNEKTLIFPKKMTICGRNRIVNALKDPESMKPEINSFHDLAYTTECKQQIILEAFLLNHDEEFRKLLRKSGPSLIQRTAEKGENDFLDLIRNFRNDNILTPNMIKKGLGIAEEKGWTSSSAELLQLTEKKEKKRKRSFSL